MPLTADLGQLGTHLATCFGVALGADGKLSALGADAALAGLDNAVPDPGLQAIRSNFNEAVEAAKKAEKSSATLQQKQNARQLALALGNEISVNPRIVAQRANANVVPLFLDVAAINAGLAKGVDQAEENLKDAEAYAKRKDADLKEKSELQKIEKAEKDAEKEQRALLIKQLEEEAQQLRKTVDKELKNKKGKNMSKKGVAAAFALVAITALLAGVTFGGSLVLGGVLAGGAKLGNERFRKHNASGRIEQARQELENIQNIRHHMEGGMDYAQARELVMQDRLETEHERNESREHGISAEKQQQILDALKASGAVHHDATIDHLNFEYEDRGKTGLLPDGTGVDFGKLKITNSATAFAGGGPNFTGAIRTNNAANYGVDRGPAAPGALVGAMGPPEIRFIKDKNNWRQVTKEGKRKPTYGELVKDGQYGWVIKRSAAHGGAQHGGLNDICTALNAGAFGRVGVDRAKAAMIDAYADFDGTVAGNLTVTLSGKETILNEGKIEAVKFKVTRNGNNASHDLYVTLDGSDAYIKGEGGEWLRLGAPAVAEEQNKFVPLEFYNATHHQLAALGEAQRRALGVTGNVGDFHMRGGTRLNDNLDVAVAPAAGRMLLRCENAASRNAAQTEYNHPNNGAVPSRPAARVGNTGIVV